MRMCKCGGTFKYHPGYEPWCPEHYICNKCHSTFSYGDKSIEEYCVSEFFAFPSIEQFRNVIRDVKTHHDYKGKDESGKAVYRNTSVYPTIKFTGTVKLHGTNAAISFDSSGNITCQSRNNVITPVKDNAGFACWVHANRDAWQEYVNWLRNELQMLDGETCVIYGEWCGGNIQKGVGITGLDKMFVIFAIKIVDDRGEERVGHWMNSDQVWEAVEACNVPNVYSVITFGTWEMAIDFNRPEEFQNRLGELTQQVEDECPCAKYFGVSGIGEGIVWEAFYNGHRLVFKVKGEKHSSSKVKILASVDVERVASIKECAEKVCTENRMNQGRDWIINQEGLDAARPENLGAFLKWLNGDIFKEEMDTIVDSGLSPKEVSKEINRIGREFYFRSM